MRLALFCLLLSFQFGLMGCAIRQTNEMHTVYDLNDFCPGGEVYENNGIECCLERVTKTACEQAIGELPAFMFNEIERIQSMDFPYQRGPNCHWTVLRYFDAQFSYPANLTLIDQTHVIALIESKKLQEIPQSQAREGDIILYADRSEIRMTDVNERGQLIQRRSRLTNSIAHTGVLLNGGLVFSKEDAASNRFTIDSQSSLVRIWKDRLGKHPTVVRSELKIQYYRPTSADLLQVR